MSMIEEYIATAKRGRWAMLGAAVKNMAKISMKVREGYEPGATYSGDFRALTQGAHFEWLEGSDSNYKVIFVAPDDSIDFASINSMTVTGALDYLARYCAEHTIPEWDDFVKWFDSKWSTYGQYMANARFTICGKTASRIASYTNPNSRAAIWFAWLYANAVNAGCSTVQMSSYHPTTYRYSLPMTISLGSTSISINLLLTY